MISNTEESYLDFRQRNPNFKKDSDSCVIVSGGLDSTVLVYDMLSQGYTPHMLSFNYGQRHKKELKFASYTAVKLGLLHDIIDLSGITELISNSALTSGIRVQHTTEPGYRLGYTYEPIIEVPEGHYAEDTMKATVVPNRNMIMLSIAAGVAVNYKYKAIGIGVHGGDHFIYPDCRPAFIGYVNDAIVDGNEGFHRFARQADDGSLVAIYAPFLTRTKADIACRGIELQVPFHETWSCYKGDDKHCGKCGTCVERLEAINEAIERKMARGGPIDITRSCDETEYVDKNFWRTATKS